MANGTSSFEFSGPLIELRDVVKRFGGNDGSPAVEALRGVSLRIHTGEFVAITGVSGSGKSTLMHLLGCLDQPSEGTYLFAGRDIARLGSDELAALRREAFGFVFQHYNLIATESALENVKIPALYAGMIEAERKQRASDLLGRFGLQDRTAHLPRQLSGGEQQRVSIARALINGGRIILADEPTGALDSQNSHEVMALLKELSQQGHTVILVTHDREVAANANRVIEICDGRVIADTGAASPAKTLPIDHPGGRQQGVPGVDFKEVFRTAWRVMWLHRFRTALTLLGIVIGIASVIVMLAIGAGAQRKIMLEMADLGVDNMYVMPMMESSLDLGGLLTLEDAETLRHVPNIRFVMPHTSFYATARRGNIDYRVEVAGTTGDFLQGMSWKLAQGVFIDAKDEKMRAKVAVLGDQARRALFPDGSDPVGRTILIDNVPFELIGVLSPKGAMAGDLDSDNRILIPFPTAVARLTGNPHPDWLLVSIKDIKRAADTEKAMITALAAQRRGTDFRVYNSAEAIRLHNETDNTMRTMLGLLAVISLVVGGIGVMNVMLMAVSERTREIGIRMAIGARQRDVMRQFLIEAVLVTASGGAVGLAAGILIGMILLFMGVPIIFSLSAMIMALGCAVLTGLIFGYTPANKAARLHPVIALASE